MDTMKRIGAGILGALEGVLVVFIITAIMLVVNDNPGSLMENVSVVWCVIAGILGAIICACYPAASLAIFVGLVIIIRVLFVRDRRD